jgi:molybdopterin-biosynthesis enzyme MoeA-like protein
MRPGTSGRHYHDGRLGPTVDDMTRQAVANAPGRDLGFQSALFDQIADRFRRLGSPMPDNNRQQAYIPAGATPIENPVGTAPCFIVESERGIVISLPGVPSEMKYLLDAAVLPYLQRWFN